MTEAVAAWAAVAAAVFGLVNVILSNRFTRSSQDRQWRRESTLEMFSGFLDTTRELSNAWRTVAETMRLPTEPDTSSRSHETQAPDLQQTRVDATRKAHELLREAHRRLAELELIATARCVRAAQNLIESLEQPMMTSLRPGGSSDKLGAYGYQMEHVRTKRQEFVSACREDLGAGKRIELVSWWAFH